MSIALNDTTPAAPAGGTNIKWQRDVSGNVSAYINVAPELIGNNVDSTAQSANIGTTTLVSSPSAGGYRVSCYIVLTQAATSSSTLPQIQITWQDFDTGVTKTANVTASGITTNTIGDYSQGDIVISAAAATISYSTTGYASSGVTPMQYKIHIRTEYTA
jgi:alpha-D-ribose 1-methylphosphonate 5-triphosphate diphosphatase PhnM